MLSNNTDEIEKRRHIIQIRVFLCMAIACFLGGFFLAASSPDNVFSGIALMIVGAFCAFITIILVSKLNQAKNEHNENRIKSLKMKLKC